MIMENKQFKLIKIDVFATEKSSGNPAGCIFLENSSDINENEMQQITVELKEFVNEVYLSKNPFVSIIKLILLRSLQRMFFQKTIRSGPGCLHPLSGILKIRPRDAGIQPWDITCWNINCGMGGRFQSSRMDL